MSQLIKSDKPDDGPIADLIRTRAVAIAIFVAVMTASILVLDGISSSDDPPSLGSFSKRVDYFREHHDQYNVLLVGTSMMYRSRDTVLLKDVSSQNGCDIRAFNLGISQLRLTDLRYIRDQSAG